MKLCRFTIDGITRVGRIDGDRVVDLSALAGTEHSMRRVIALHSERPDEIASIAAESFALDHVLLEAPIADPRKFLAIGMNYQKHADEAAAAGIPVPTSQLWFNKQTSCITGPYAPVDLPRVSNKLDYEAELAFVIGRGGRHIAESDALAHVAGYLVCNDVSVRDWQARSPTFTLGKSFDTHGPIGPWITTADEVLDPHSLTLSLSVNGEERQRSSTGDMIYNIAQQIAYLSQVMTLEPGDLVATGTPAGVGIADNSFLTVGDVVRVEVDGLGYIENAIRAEP